ncbi:hypothetical protein GIY23_17350 [Allosaccharopolyspora coralli]|uniref:Zinc-finger domain-containing protein n=1 Tax=Allosaccharopolyspora coralli TaxID=2665642 RepID=A0A5Q3Q8Q4_9PSEU|nr:hypothetical protein [Allosaccharopolyspora coralli]QGK71051.1 hypothetical protein GIY23_17350 [Allosaccharopolyspora coralli]
MRTKDSDRANEHVEIQHKLDAYQQGRLDDVEWVLVRTHVAECDMCRADMDRPKLWNRASPQRILPAGEHEPALTGPAVPSWLFVTGTASVAALVAFGIGFALGTGA